MTIDTASRANSAKLTDYLFEKMIASSEVWSLAALADDIAEFESHNGCRFALEEIAVAWIRAADWLIDSMIGNEYDTPDSECDTPIDQRVAKWEKQRPTTIRRNELASKFKGF